METDNSIIIFSLFGLSLVLSALFSGSEVSFFSIEKTKLEQFNLSSKFVENLIAKLLSEPKKLLISFLLGNTICNVAASIFSVMIALDLAEKYSASVEAVLTVQIFSLTIIILLFTEIIPKLLASKASLGFAKVSALFIYIFYTLLYPFAEFINLILDSIFKKINLAKIFESSKTAEINDLAEFGKEKGAIEEDQKELIEGVAHFAKICAREVMTPRVDIVAAKSDISFNDLIKLINESGHSRIPVYEENIDEINGIVYSKDLIPFLFDEEKKKSFDVKKIARKTIYIPESKLISDLMKEFQEKKIHMGIVVDEYGGTAGLITMEDILEEIVGDIRDEYDIEENWTQKIDDNSFYVVGKFPLIELNELLGTDIFQPNEDYDTISGMIMSKAGKIPETGFSIVESGYKFEVKEIQKNRIKKVLIQKISKD